MTRSCNAALVGRSELGQHVEGCPCDTNLRTYDARISRTVLRERTSTFYYGWSAIAESGKVATSIFYTGMRRVHSRDRAFGVHSQQGTSIFWFIFWLCLGSFTVRYSCGDKLNEMPTAVGAASAHQKGKPARHPLCRWKRERRCSYWRPGETGMIRSVETVPQ